MTAVVDTSVIVDVLRGVDAAKDLLVAEMRTERLHASEITRLEVLAGMRSKEEHATRLLLGTLVWHPVDESTAERAGALGRQWLPSHRGIDGADLAIAATADLLAARLLTRNVRLFPMFGGLDSPY